MTNNERKTVIYQLEADDLERIVTRVVIDAMERYTSSTTPTRDANNDSDELWTVQQVSQYLHRSRSTLWRYEQLGILKPIRVGRSVYFSRSDVLSILNKIL